MFKKSRKGVSPVIATLLLIVIAVAAAVVTYSWVMGFIGTTTTAPVQTQARIVIDAAMCDVFTNATGTFCNVTVYVRNVGTTQVNVTGLYVYDASSNLLESFVGKVFDTQNLAKGSPDAFGVTVSPNSVRAVIAIKQTNAISVGDLIYFKAVTAEGATATSETTTAT